MKQRIPVWRKDQKLKKLSDLDSPDITTEIVQLGIQRIEVSKDFFTKLEKSKARLDKKIAKQLKAAND